MDYAESVEQAREYARAALDFMERRAIAPHPNNFTIWFNYFSGHYPDLKRTLDILLDNDQEFNEQRNADIFQKFFSSIEESISVGETARRADEALIQLLAILGAAGQDTARYGDTLMALSGAVSGRSKSSSSSGTELSAVLADVLTATRSMEARNKALEEKLTASSKEIHQLREDLEDMRREALTDALTGIANRKLFDIELRRLATVAMERGSPLTLLMLDIDFFKKFNDSYGHQVGDQVLRLMATTLTTSVKGRDLPARYGGEEFAVILPDTPLVGGVTVAESIRARVHRKDVVNRKSGESLGKVSVSIGVALFDFGEPLGQFIARADGALYLAKRQGRNRVRTERHLAELKLDFDR